MAAPWRNISYPLALLVVLALTIGTMLVIGGASSTTVFGAYNPAWDGVAELRQTAETEGVETVILQETERYGTANSSDSISFILSPESNYTQAEADRVAQFIQNGGTVVVAEDFGAVSNSLLAQVGVEARFDGGLLRDERFNGDSPELPIADQIANHSYTDGVDQLTLNRGTAVIPNGATVLVNSSNYTYIDENLNGNLDESEVMAQRPVVTVESVGQGQVVVVGDPSLFINVMLEREGNRAFAKNLITTHDTVLFDLSHVAAVPPLIAARLALQRIPTLQLLLGVMFVFLVTYWSRVTDALDSVRDELSGDSPPDRAPNPEIIKQRVHERFPDWDEERVERVTKEIIQRQQKRESNE